MPGVDVATNGDGGGGIRYFRIANKDRVQWSGRNVDATPTTFYPIQVERPGQIEVTTADEQTQSGYITLEYGDDFRLILNQGSRLEVGMGVLRRLMQIPAIASGGGARDAAGAIAALVRDLIDRVRLSVTASATANLYRTVEDGGGTICVLATALTTVDGEIDPDDMGGMKFTASTRMEGGAQGPIPNASTKDAESRESMGSGGQNFNFVIGDSAYYKLLPVGQKAVTVSITLEADIAPILEQSQMNEFIDEIQEKLRAFGLVQRDGEDETIDPPEQEPGEENSDFLQKVANFGSQLLEVYQAVLNAVLDSIKRRAMAALVTRTVLSLEFAESVPEDVATQLHLARAPADAEKLAADLVIEERATALDGGPGRSVRVIERPRLSPEMIPYIERMVTGDHGTQDGETSVAYAFPRAIERELDRYSTAELREVATTYRPLFELPDGVDLRRLSKKQLLKAFRLHEPEKV